MKGWARERERERRMNPGKRKGEGGHDAVLAVTNRELYAWKMRTLRMTMRTKIRDIVFTVSS